MHQLTNRKELNKNIGEASGQFEAVALLQMTLNTDIWKQFSRVRIDGNGTFQEL